MDRPTPPVPENLTPVSKDDPSVRAQFQRILQLPSSYYCKITGISEIDGEIIGTSEMEHWRQGANALWLTVRRIGDWSAQGVNTGAAIRNGRFWVLEPASQWREVENLEETAEDFEPERFLTMAYLDLTIATKVMRGPNKLYVEWYMKTDWDENLHVLMATWGLTGSLERVDHYRDGTSAGMRFVGSTTFVFEPLEGPIPYPPEIQ